ncbi:MAG: hypothetical protein QRY74_04330 [Chlamydia sp.]
MKGASDSLFHNLFWLPSSIKNGLIAQLAAKQIHPFLILLSLSTERKRILLEQIALAWISASIGESSDRLLHPDIIRVKPQGKSGIYVIDSIRSIIRELALQPFQNGRRVIIIEDGEQMSQAAANALLRLLEEPPKGTLFLMTISQSQKILSTILSRSEIIRIPAPSLFERKTYPLQESVEQVAKSLFMTLYRPSYGEIQKATDRLIHLYEKAIEEMRGESIGLDLEEKEAFVSAQRNRIGELFIGEIRNGWQQQLVVRGSELSGISGERRFPDDSLLFFHHALSENLLALHFQEIVMKLLLLLFGHTSRRELSSLSLHIE